MRSSLFLLFITACASSSSSDKVIDTSGESLVIMSTSPESHCQAIPIEALARHPEQAPWSGTSTRSYEVGLLLTDTDHFSSAIVENRSFRLHTNADREVNNVDVEVTGTWPSGNAKWLWLRWNGRIRIAEKGYTFYWGEHPDCQGSEVELGATTWQTGNDIFVDSQPTTGCTPDGTGCLFDGSGVEAHIDLAANTLLENLQVEGEVAVAEGILPILEGKYRSDTGTIEYSTEITWDSSATRIKTGRAGSQIWLTGVLASEDKPIAQLEVALDVRRNQPKIGLDYSFTWLQQGSPKQGFAWEAEDSSIGEEMSCTLDEVKYQPHPYTIDRFGLLVLSGENSISNALWGECIGTGQDRDCADNSTIHAKAITGDTLLLQQHGPRSYQIDGVTGSQHHLAGWVSTLGPKASIEVAVQHFWQTYPSGFELRNRGIGIDLYPNWAPDWSFSFYEEDGSPSDPLIYKPLPGHAVPGEANCSPEEMDFYNHFLQDNLVSEPPGTGCNADHMKRSQVVAHGASRSHAIELAFYQASDGDMNRGARRASLLNHPVILRQHPDSFLRTDLFGIQMVAKQDDPEFAMLESALEEIHHLNSLRFSCRHDFGFWHFGKAQGHYGVERLDRWVDGLQYGHQLIPWLLFVRGGSRDTYEEAMIQARHGYDLPINKHYLDPDWTEQNVATSDFSASPFNWGCETMGFHDNIHFLTLYHHLGGAYRVPRLLQELAKNIDSLDDEAIPKASQRLRYRNRTNYVGNTLLAVLNQEVADDQDLDDPDLPSRLAAYEARWLQRTFSINDMDIDNDGSLDESDWIPNFLPYNGVQSSFAFPHKGLERGLLLQWVRGNFLDESESLSGQSYFSYVLQHAEEHGYTFEPYRGLASMEAIQLGPMLSTITGNPEYAQKSWIHADRISRVMPRWDGLVRDAAEPIDYGPVTPMLTDYFDESRLRDLTQGLLAGISARVTWDLGRSWEDGAYHDSLFKIGAQNAVYPCSFAWLRSHPSSDANIQLIADGTFGGFTSAEPWFIEIDILQSDDGIAFTSILETGPYVFYRPSLDPALILASGSELFSLYRFPESLTQAVNLPASDKDYLIAAKYHSQGHSNSNGFFQVVPLDSHSQVVHYRPLGGNSYDPIDFASQGLNNLTTMSSFSGASILVKLDSPDRDQIQLWDMNAESTEPFSFRDADGVPARLLQTTTYNEAEGHLKGRLVLDHPPLEWLELTTAGQGRGRLGVDGRSAPYRNRSVYVPATLDRSQWFEPSQSTPACEAIFSYEE